jgi:hypothetical protein
MIGSALARKSFFFGLDIGRYEFAGGPGPTSDDVA